MRDLQQEGGRGKTPLGDHFQHLVSTVTRPSKTLARSRFRSWPLRRDAVHTYATAELFKNSAAAVAEFGKA